MDPQFHCSYLESRGVPGKTRGENAGNYLPFISGSRLPVMQLPVAHAHAITSGTPSLHPLKCGLSCAYILLMAVVTSFTLNLSKFRYLLYLNFLSGDTITR